MNLPPEPPRPDPKPWLERTLQIDAGTAGLLGALIVVGLLLRLRGIHWSLPDARHPLGTYHPDELMNFGAAANVDPFRGQLDLQFYNYGALFFYLVAYAWIFARGWGLVPEPPKLDLAPGAVPTAAQLSAGAPSAAALYLAGRLVSVLFGTLTIPLVFALGNRLFGRRTGLLAAGLYAIAPLAVVHAHFMTVDVTATFFVALALAASGRLLSEPTWKSYALAGAAVGLAAGTKYNTALVIAAPIAAHLMNRSTDPIPATRSKRLALLFAASVVAFLIACPGPLINWSVFWNGTYPESGVRYELFVHPRAGHGNLFTATGSGWWYHLRISLLFGLGLPLLLPALVGIGWSLYRRSRQDALLLAFVLIYFAVAGLSAVRFARYMLPLYPPLFVLAARFVTEASRDRRAAAPVYGAVGIVALLTLAYTVELLGAMTSRAPQDAAADYLEQHAQAATVAFPRLPWFDDPPLSPWFDNHTNLERRLTMDPGTRFTFRLPHGDWDPSVLTPPPDYVIVTRFERLHDLDRLVYPNAIRFMHAIPLDMRCRSFGPPTVALLPTVGPLLPDDLLYILPQICVYERPP